MSFDAYQKKAAKKFKKDFWWDTAILLMHGLLVVLWLITDHSREAVILSAIIYWRAPGRP